MRRPIPVPVERRDRVRARARLTGLALTARGWGVRCLVLDLSPAGASVEPLSDHVLPDAFRLRFGREERPVRAVWRTGRAVGVRFVEPRPVPDVIPD